MIQILTEESKKTICSIADYINNGKNLRIEPIDLSLKKKCIAYCPELPFGIISPCSYLNIETMNTISDTKITKKLSVIQKETILSRFLKYVGQLIKE